MLLKRRCFCPVSLLRTIQFGAGVKILATRCKAGDTALILFDEPDCLGNVGRLVKVHPTLKTNIRLKLDCWIIEPIDDLPWIIAEADGSIRQEVITQNSNVEHPDVWMLPIQEEGYTDEEMAAYVRI